MTKFELYLKDTAWWSFEDYGSLIRAVRRFCDPKVLECPWTALEFGPGGSTLALLEAGASTVDACEDDPEWRKVYEQRLAARFPNRVRVHPYVVADKISVDGLDDRRFDVGFVDAPRTTLRRQCTINYALARCDVVLCHDVITMAKYFDYSVEIEGTVGRLS